MSLHLATDEELEEFFSAWRTGRLPVSRFTHVGHVAVGAYLAFGNSLADTFAAIRDGILAYNAAVGTPNTDTGGYHETMTRFWVILLHQFVASGGFACRLDAVRAAAERFGGDVHLYRRHYSFDLFGDARARHEWVAPDLEPLSWSDIFDIKQK